MKQVKWNNERGVKDAFKDLKETPTSNISSDNLAFFEINNVSWYFTPKQYGIWHNLIKNFIKYYKYEYKVSYPVVEKLFMEKYAEKRLSKYSSFEKVDTLDIEDKIRQLTNHEHTFYFSLEYIKIDKVYNFENITLIPRNSNPAFYKELKTIQDIFLADHIHEDAITDIKKSTELNDYNLIKIKIIGEYNFANQNALYYSRLFLNEVLFFANLSYKFIPIFPCLEIDKPNKKPTYVCIDNFGGVRSGKLDNQHVSTILFSDSFTKNVNFENLRHQERLPFLLNQYNFPIFQKIQSNELLKRISLGINWHSEAYRTKNKPTEFLNYCIGLEALFTDQSIDDGVNENLAHRCAFLLTDHKGDYEYLKKEIKKLYKQRSGIAHGRNPQILDSDSNQIKSILSASILNLYDLIKTKNMQSAKDLTSYFELAAFNEDGTSKK